uniref:Uncharacterized protein LOC104241434 n=1 Tax=Nicotiana sylvestris TaxID=4096 RepID=A0A1U7XRH7_NICSY|nr:PREDICTED: uncharacterized protein LOC104241434 [Nicotiana sylvestris]
MESGTDQIMQLHLNVPLKTPLQHLHDLVTHNVAPSDEDLLRQNPMEDEGDDESTAENFKRVAREGDLSPTASAKGVVEWELVEDTEQQVIVKVFHHDLGQHMMMTFVYAKCSVMERLELWDHLYYLEKDMEFSWLVGWDFNVVLHEDEKIWGLPVHPPEYEDFAFCVNSCGLFEQGYKGSPFTWWDGRPNDKCIFKRLDRIFVNFQFQNMLPTIEVEHLIRTRSDHAPLLMTCGDHTTNFVKPFRFLNFWTKHATFMKVLAILEDIVRVKEMLFEEETTIENRIVLQKAQYELKKYLSIEEQYWKQKAGMTWFVEGDRNTSFFHNHVNGKRKKLQLKRIKNGSGVWIEDQEQLATVAVDFYQK